MAPYLMANAVPRKPLLRTSETGSELGTK